MVRPRGPLWDHVTIATGYGTSGMKRWICKYCKNTYTGGPARIRAHLLCIRGHEIGPCTMAPEGIATQLFMHPPVDVVVGQLGPSQFQRPIGSPMASAAGSSAAAPEMPFIERQESHGAAGTSAAVAFMRHLNCRGFEILIVGIAVVLIFSKLLSLWPGQPSSNFTTSASLERKEMAAGQALAPAIAVYVTVPNEETGKKLAKSIITNKLAACVNQVPGIESTYWWKGQVETDSELLLIIKTRQSLLEALTQHVKENHPYEVPEVISLPITGGNEQYLKWLHDSTADHRDS